MKLVDLLGREPSAATHAGSSPAPSTTLCGYGVMDSTKDYESFSPDSSSGTRATLYASEAKCLGSGLPSFLQLSMINNTESGLSKDL